MTTPTEHEAMVRIHFDPVLVDYLTAVKEEDLYQFRSVPPYIQTRRRDKSSSTYNVLITEQDADLMGFCNCKGYLKGYRRPCKHCFMAAVFYISAAVKSKLPADHSEAIQCVILDDYPELDAFSAFDTPHLENTFKWLETQVRAPKLPRTDLETDDEWVSDMQKDDSFGRVIEVTHQDKSVTIPPQKVVTFVDDFKKLPKDLVMSLGGKPYIRKAGLLFLAKKEGLKSIESRPVAWSWESEEKRAVFESTALFNDGSHFTAYGVAIPEKGNIKMEEMWPFVDHLAETRATCRALRLALAFGYASAEEMSEFEGATE